MDDIRSPSSNGDREGSLPEAGAGKVIKRGRKQDNSLPPNRSRDVQRAFRARKADQVLSLEARVNRLLGEVDDLRARLGEPPRNNTPPPPPLTGSGSKAAGAPKKKEKDLEQQAKEEQERDGINENQWRNSNEGIVNTNYGPTEYDPMQEGHGSPGYRWQQQQHQLLQQPQQNMRMEYNREQSLRQSQPSQRPSPPSHLTNSQLPPIRLPQQHSQYSPLPSSRPLSPETIRRNSGSGSSGAYNPNFPQPTPYWQQPDLAQRSLQHPQQQQQHQHSSNPYPPHPDQYQQNPQQDPRSLELSRRPSSELPNGPLGVYGELTTSSRSCKPTAMRPQPPTLEIETLFLSSFCSPPLPSFTPSSPDLGSSAAEPVNLNTYRSFCTTLLKGLEVTGKGRTGRVSWTTAERALLEVDPECCGGLLDCYGPLFDEKESVASLASVKEEFITERSEGFSPVGDVWRESVGLIPRFIGNEVDLAEMILSGGEDPSAGGAKKVSEDVRCETGHGLLVRQRTFETVRGLLEQAEKEREYYANYNNAGNGQRQALQGGQQMSGNEEYGWR